MQTATMTIPTDTQGSDAARWAAVNQRDERADGTFVYAVTTTGVFCRPSCPSRLARRDHVQFFATNEAASRAGYRPCKRCQPGQPGRAERQVELVARACRAIEAAETPPTLADLAAIAGVSPFHLHRLFKAETGVTPRAYAAALRAERARAALTRGETITGAVYSAGFSGSGRFYEAADGMLGMTPTAFKHGAPDAAIRFAVGACDLGALLVAATERGICAISLGDDPDDLVRELQARFPRARFVGDDAEFAATVATVAGFVQHPGLGLGLPLDIRGTAFQQRVWQALRQVPAGSTVSYSELARRAGAPGAARATATACATNPLAVAIPCHRVVRVDGGLAGYRWGVPRKQALLARERETTSAVPAAS